MKGLIIAATKPELAPCIRALKANKAWGFVITGVGGAATAYALAKAIQNFQPTFLLQAGIGGSFDTRIKPGSVVAIRSDQFGDLGVTENNKRKNLFELKLAGINERPFRNGKLTNPDKKILQLASLPVVDAVSVNEVTTKKADISFYKKKYNASVESMEGAAFHYVALMEKIPFLQIRSISNDVGERNKEKWNMVAAINNLNAAVSGIIKILNDDFLC